MRFPPHLHGTVSVMNTQLREYAEKICKRRSTQLFYIIRKIVGKYCFTVNCHNFAYFKKINLGIKLVVKCNCINKM